MMSWLCQTLARIRAFFQKSKLDRELEDELAAHIELATLENVSRGMDSDAARREALRQFGGHDAIRELNRETRGLPAVDSFIQDVRHGFRLLRSSPLFALTAAASLAIGIGADIAVFTVANAFLFQTPRGVSDGGRLVEISLSRDGDFGVEEISHPNYVDIRRRVTMFEDICEYELLAGAMSVTGPPDGAEAILGHAVGLLLAAIGIYGVTAYAVERRTREIGIRIALGAQRGKVASMVLRQGMSLVAIGSFIGVLFSAVAGLFAKRMLFACLRSTL